MMAMMSEDLTGDDMVDLSIPPLKWEDFNPTPPITTTTWDFSPFLTAPAVKRASRTDGQVNLLNIPQTKIPSPFAHNLSPRHLRDIKDSLLGADVDHRCCGNGKEVWLSWKRAWDIWNNHYIQGRENPIWIREEWERRDLAQKEWDAGRDERTRKRDAARGHPPVVPNHGLRLPADKVPKIVPFRMKTGYNIPTGRGSERIAFGWSLWDKGIKKVPVDPQHPFLEPIDEIKHDQKWIKVWSKVKGRTLLRKLYWVLVNKRDRSDRSVLSTVEEWEAEEEDDDENKEDERDQEDEDENKEDEHDQEDVEMPDFMMDHAQEDLVGHAEPYSDSEPPRPLTTLPGGQSGGWFALSDLPEYYEPEDDTYDGKVWVDVVANSVWRPRRVGEKTLNISLDDDIEAFFKNGEFQVDGGVDCSRSPYPVLRPVIEYVRTQDGAYRKKKAWDGVTGTIFNIPTKPLEPCPDIKDEKAELIGNMYSDPFRDNDDTKIFPLDIRRVLKVEKSRHAPRHICDRGEELVRDPALYLPKEYRHMRASDPWYVTNSQKIARDVPPRRHPPKQEEFSGAHLPLDDQLWQEELSRDLRYRAGYFVTNLHGGTLVVNGMQIRKGDVAGPLPEFAIIECPGGQVAFWWGVNGRHYRPEIHDKELLSADYDAKWDLLGKEDGWQHVGKRSGEVWDYIIRDRREREKIGENEDDDEQWARWKRARRAVPLSDDTLERPQPNGSYGPIPLFHKDNGEEELKWLHKQAEEKRRMLDTSAKASSLIIPNENSQWPGSVPPIKLSHELTPAETIPLWNSAKPAQLILQNTINEKVEKEKAKLQKKRDEKEKRQADDFLHANLKRRRLDDKLARDVAEKAAKDLRDAADAKKAAMLRREAEAQRLKDDALRGALTSLDPVEEEIEEIMEIPRRQAADMEKARVERNKERKIMGQPEIPAKSSLNLASMKATKDTLGVDAKKGAAEKEVLQKKACTEEKKEANVKKVLEDNIIANVEREDRSDEELEKEDKAEKVHDSAAKSSALTRERLERVGGQKRSDALRAHAKAQLAEVDEKRSHAATVYAQAAYVQGRPKAHDGANLTRELDEKPIQKVCDQKILKALQDPNSRPNDANAQNTDTHAMQDVQDNAGLTKQSIEESVRSVYERGTGKVADEKMVSKIAAAVALEQAKLKAERASDHKKISHANAQQLYKGTRLKAQQAADAQERSDATAAEAENDYNRAMLNVEKAADAKKLCHVKAQNEHSQAAPQAHQAEDQKQQSDAAFAQSIQGRLAILRDRFYNAQGPEKVTIAQSYVSLHNAARTKAENDSYLAWNKTLAPKDVIVHQKIFQDAYQAIRSARNAALSPPKANPLPLSQPASPTIDLPSIVDTNPRNIIENVEPWMHDYEKAIALSTEQFSKDFMTSLRERALSQDMTDDQYAQSLGFDNAEQYLGDQFLQQQGMVLDKHEKNLLATPDLTSPKAEYEGEEFQFAMYQQELKDAFRDGIEARAARECVTPSRLARSVSGNYPSVTAWVEDLFLKAGLTKDMVPSRKITTEMSEDEVVYEQEIWAAWCKRLCDARNFNHRIANLPKGPNWSSTRSEKGNTYCLL